MSPKKHFAESKEPETEDDLLCGPMIQSSRMAKICSDRNQKVVAFGDDGKSGALSGKGHKETSGILGMF